MLAGTKGTKEYNEIMTKLQEQNYKHQAEEKGGNLNFEEDLNIKQENIPKQETKIALDQLN